MDLTSGNRIWPVSGTFPAIPELPTTLTVSPSGALLIAGQIDGAVPNSYAGVFSLDSVTHQSTMVSSNILGSGPLFVSNGPTGIAAEADGTVLLNETTLNAVLSIDPNTGNRTILSDATHGTGPTINAPEGILVVPSVPEPSTFALAALGGLALLAWRRG